MAYQHCHIITMPNTKYKHDQKWKPWLKVYTFFIGRYRVMRVKCIYSYIFMLVCYTVILHYKLSEFLPTFWHLHPIAYFWPVFIKLRGFFLLEYEFHTLLCHIWAIWYSTHVQKKKKNPSINCSIKKKLFRLLFYVRLYRVKSLISVEH